MRGKQIPDADHVIRHAKATHVQPDGRVSAVAFMLRSKLADGSPEEYLSINWLENLHASDRAIQIEMARSELAANLTLRSSQKLLRLNVGGTRQYVTQKMADGRQIGFHHEWLAASPSHSGIYDCRPDEDMIAELIAQTVVSIHDAVAPPPNPAGS